MPLVATAVALGLIAYGIRRSSQSEATRAADQEAASQAAPNQPPPIETLLKVDVLELEVGYAIVPLIDKSQGGDLLERINAIRRQLAVDLGLVMPPVRIRDNMQLAPTEYRIKVRGAEIARSHVHPEMLMAMDPGIATGTLEGEPTTEPAFGLKALWISPQLRQRAETMNYTVVDATSVMATHLTELVKRHASELLTREEVNNLIEGLKTRAPKLCEEAIPAIVKPAELQRVLHNLLREGVPIRDMETIVETLADWAPRSKDLDILTEYTRNALRRCICEQHAVMRDGLPTLVCVTLDPAFEDQVSAYVERGTSGTTVSMPARIAADFAGKVASALRPVLDAGHAPLVLASPQVRGPVWQMLEPHIQGVTVLGYNEIVTGVEIESLGLVTPQSPASDKAVAPAAVA